MNKVQRTFSEYQQQLVIWMLLALMPIVGMAVDLISPALPAIADNLNVSIDLVKELISIYLLGYALGNFFTGFLTDAFGRKKLLLLGLMGFVLISLLPMIFPKIGVLLFTRLLQGLTIGMISVTARATFSDILSPEKLVKLGVIIGSMFALGPIFGPFFGGYLQFYFGWQSCFLFFSVVVGILFVAVFFIVPETHFNRHTLNFTIIKHNLFELFTHRKFMGTIIMMGAVYSPAITFNTVGPFLIQTKLHYTPIFFGKIGLIMGLSFLCATLFSRYLLNKYTVEKILLVSINASWVIGIAMLIAGIIFDENIVLLCIASATMFFAQGLIFPMSMGNGLSLFRHIAGTATAIMFLVNILITSFVAFTLSFINIQSMLSLFGVYFSLATVSFLVFYVFIFSKKDKYTEIPS